MKIGIVTGVVVMTWFDYHMATIAAFGSFRSSYTPAVTSPPPVLNPPLQTTPPVTVQTGAEYFDNLALSATRASLPMTEGYHLTVGEVETDYGTTQGNLQKIMGHYTEIYGMSEPTRKDIAKSLMTSTPYFREVTFPGRTVSAWVVQDGKHYTGQLIAQTARFGYSTFLRWTKGSNTVMVETVRTRKNLPEN